jgi:hypothetical protein
MGLNFVHLMVLFGAIFGQTGHRLPPLLPRSFQQRSTNAPVAQRVYSTTSPQHSTAAKFRLEAVLSTRGVWAPLSSAAFVIFLGSCGAHDTIQNPFVSATRRK